MNQPVIPLLIKIAIPLSPPKASRGVQIWPPVRIGGMELNPYEAPIQSAAQDGATERSNSPRLIWIVVPFAAGIIIGGLNGFGGTAGINDPACFAFVCGGACLGGFWGLVAGLTFRAFQAITAAKS